VDGGITVKELSPNGLPRLAREQISFRRQRDSDPLSSRWIW